MIPKLNISLILCIRNDYFTVSLLEISLDICEESLFISEMYSDLVVTLASYLVGLQTIAYFSYGFLLANYELQAIPTFATLLCALQTVGPFYSFPKVIANTKFVHLRQFTQSIGQTVAAHFV